LHEPWDQGKQRKEVILNPINGTRDGNELRNPRENKITERQKRPTVIRQSESMQTEVRGKRKNKAGRERGTKSHKEEQDEVKE
jgi:hypothetical protein